MTEAPISDVLIARLKAMPNLVTVIDELRLEIAWLQRQIDTLNEQARKGRKP